MAWTTWPGTADAECPGCGRHATLEGVFDGDPGSRDPGDDVMFVPNDEALCEDCQMNDDDTVEPMDPSVTAQRLVETIRDTIGKQSIPDTLNGIPWTDIVNRAFGNVSTRDDVIALWDLVMKSNRKEGSR